MEENGKDSKDWFTKIIDFIKNHKVAVGASASVFTLLAQVFLLALFIIIIVHAITNAFGLLFGVDDEEIMKGEYKEYTLEQLQEKQVDWSSAEACYDSEDGSIWKRARDWIQKGINSKCELLKHFLYISTYLSKRTCAFSSFQIYLFHSHT